MCTASRIAKTAIPSPPSRFTPNASLQIVNGYILGHRVGRSAKSTSAQAGRHIGDHDVTRRRIEAAPYPMRSLEPSSRNDAPGPSVADRPLIGTRLQ